MSNTYIEVTVTDTSGLSSYILPFTYLNPSDIKVYVTPEGGNEASSLVYGEGYTVTGNLVAFTTPVATEAKVLIKRETNSNVKAVDFQSGAMLTEGDLDTAFDQVFNLAQETKDVAVHSFDAATAAFNKVGEYLPEINTIADDLGHGAITHIDFGDLTTEIATPSSDSVIHNVYLRLDDISNLDANKTNLDTVADINEDVAKVAEVADAVGIVAQTANIDAIAKAADNIEVMESAQLFVDSGVLSTLTENINDIQHAGANAIAADGFAFDASQSADAAAQSLSTALELEETLQGMSIDNISTLVQQIEDNELLTLAGL